MTKLLFCEAKAKVGSDQSLDTTYVLWSAEYTYTGQRGLNLLRVRNTRTRYELLHVSSQNKSGGTSGMRLLCYLGENVKRNCELLVESMAIKDLMLSL